ncbi:hypothetical protein N9251_03440 [Gammaproteobacteria bacterium]|nr:hypothetical protein [Gammaproteobacteria bacterium]
MACDITLGTSTVCKTSLGGVVRILLANSTDVTSVEATTDTVDVVTMTVGTQFFEYQGLADQLSSFTGVATGRKKGVQEALTVVIDQDSPELKAAFDELIIADGLVALVETATNEWRVLGARINAVGEPRKGNGLIHNGTGDGNTSGAGNDDFVGYNYTIERRNIGHSPFADASIIDALLVPAV